MEPDTSGQKQGETSIPGAPVLGPCQEWGAVLVGTGADAGLAPGAGGLSPGSDSVTMNTDDGTWDPGPAGLWENDAHTHTPHICT